MFFSFYYLGFDEFCRAFTVAYKLFCEIFYGIGAFMAMMAIILFRMKLGRRRGMI